MENIDDTDEELIRETEIHLRESNTIIQLLIKYGTFQTLTSNNSQPHENGWHPPLTHSLGGWNESHEQTLAFLINQMHLTSKLAIVELNRLNWLQAKTLEKLYHKGLRGRHLLDIQEHIESTYPKFDYYFSEPYDALEENVLEHNMSINEAVDAVKHMKLEQFERFTVW